MSATALPAGQTAGRGCPQTEPVVEWRHQKPGGNSDYFIRAIRGEVRLWVNGEEVSGGTACNPATGYRGLESQGSPVIFRRLRVRDLP